MIWLGAVVLTVSGAAGLPSQVTLAFGRPGALWVGWTSAGPTANSTVRYGPQLSRTAHGSQRRFIDAVFHRVELELAGLEPGATVPYQCGDRRDGWSPVLQFRVPPAVGAEQEVVVPVYGDMGVTNSAGTRAALMGWVDRSDFIYHVGDIGYADDYTRYAKTSPLHDYQAVWHRWADMMHPITSRLAYMVAPGNHEADCHDYGRVLCDPRLDNFSTYNARYRMPAPESGGVQNMWFSFDYAGVHFVTINTETDYPGSPEQDGWLIKLLYNTGHFGDQLSWLERDLAQADANRLKVPWIVLMGHRPFYSSARSAWDDLLWLRVTSNLRAAFEQMLAKYKVDLYIGGHVHAYERHLPVFDGHVPSAGPLGHYHNPNCTVHVTPGGAGNVEGLDAKPSGWYSPGKFEWFGARNYSAYGFGVLRVRNRTNLHWSYRDSRDDSIIDEFELFKARN